MHSLRPPALNHGITSALWGIGLGLFIWIGLLSVDVVSRLAALVLGIAGGAVIFFLVLRLGQDESQAPGAKQ
jgi:hypothetical protein